MTKVALSLAILLITTIAGSVSVPVEEKPTVTVQVTGGPSQQYCVPGQNCVPVEN